ncbi:Helix-turn-helix domain-containing protein [Streptomyces sp. BpilaLS-43]|nr:Helix-turn-helix domain-containing protein [Streptomyces sp. BpilaLS-43]SCL94246.1 Helix-turn-helix domain-containing protein [Streptomyces sp. DpondAA-F4]
MSIGNSPEDDRPSIGHVLQQARIAAGLTVEEVSSSTRVRIPIVHAIETDDFSRCGGDVYARGHIRMLAQAVRLDPDPLIAQYDAEHGGSPAPPRRRRCSRRSGSAPSPVAPTGPRPWSPPSSP